MPGPSADGPGGTMGWVGGDININIDINVNIDTHIIIDMNIKKHIRYYPLLPMNYCLLPIAYCLEPIPYSL